MVDDNSTQNYLESESKTESEDIDFLEGVCPKCLDSGYVHTVKDGVLGVKYIVDGVDSLGKPIKRLLRCEHNKSYSY